MLHLSGRPHLAARHPAWLSHVARVLLVFCFFVASSGCETRAECGNGGCICLAGSECHFECTAAPCHVECRGDNSSCSGACANGTCECGPDSRCDFACDAPPCHVDCAPGADCSGSCANGECRCADGAECAFDCLSGPCHVSCGAKASCSGVCSNGTCECGVDGACSFTCLDGPCKTECPNGAEGLLTCDANNRGSGCQFDSCSGTVVECPDGKTLACNRPCPSQ